MFKTQTEVLQSCLNQTLLKVKISETDADFVVFPVEELPCRPSTAIKAIGYKSSANELYIQWKNGNTTRRYYRVPPSVWEQFRDCTASIGKLYHRVIKSSYGSTDCENLIE